MKFPQPFFAFLAVLSLFTACKKGFDQSNFTPEEIGRYIAARVPAMIDPGDPVMIRFSVPVDTSQTSSVFSFSPDVKGRTWWEDDLTLAFQPEQGWQPATDYQLEVNLEKIIKDVDPKMKRVVFDFTVKPVRLSVAFEPLVPEFDGDNPSYINLHRR